MSVCDDYCVPCVYLSRLSNMTKTCNYLLVTGERRGCSAGTGCSRRVIGEKKPSIDWLILSGRNEEKLEAAETARMERQGATQTRQASLSEHSIKKRKLAEKTRQYWQGRQTAAIKAFLAKNHMPVSALARQIGTSETALRRWIREANNADWERLALVGIKKPETD